MSQMEKTLRLPYVIRITAWNFLNMTAPKWLILFFGLWLISRNILVSILLGFMGSLIWEMFTLRTWYQKTVFPIHQGNMLQIRKMFEEQSSYPASKFASKVEFVAEKSAWSMVQGGYSALPSWGWEIVFKLLYPFLVLDKSIPYQNLLIGFNNKTIEADQKLWEVSQETDIETQRKLLESYLDEFGSKVDDWDIALPTLRERPIAIRSLLTLSKFSPSPKSRLESARIKREQSIIQLQKQLRVPKVLFNWLLQIVQQNVALREDRRYFEFQADYYLRQMLLRLAKLNNIPEDKLFKMSWKEVKHAAQR